MSYTETQAMRLKDGKSLASKVKTVTDGHEDRITAIEKDLTALKTRTGVLNYSNVGAANNLVRGANLGTTITPAQFAALQAGGISGDTRIYVGDYWRLSGEYSLVVADFDYFHGYEVGAGTLGRHAVLLVGDNKHVSIPMNKDDDGNELVGAAGLTGFANTWLYKEVLSEVLSDVTELLGEDIELLSVNNHVADAIDTTSYKPSHFVAASRKIFLPTLSQVWGVQRSGFSHYLGMARQFTIFQHVRMSYGVHYFGYQGPASNILIPEIGVGYASRDNRTDWLRFGWGQSTELYTYLDNGHVPGNIWPYIVVGHRTA